MGRPGAALEPAMPCRYAAGMRCASMNAAMNRQRLDEWYDTPRGRDLWRRERALLAPLVSRCFGHHGLEIGTPARAESLLVSGSMGHRIRLRIDAGGRHGGDFRGHLDALALRPRSLAAVVLVHVLDYLPAPAAALAALEQALVPGGRLLAVCFDPLSLPGLRQRLGRQHLPWWPERAGSARRCGDWLRGLHLEVEHRYRAWRWPLAARTRWQRRLGRLDALAPSWPLGAVYVVCARKRERQGTAIPLSGRLPRRILAPGVPRPTSGRIIVQSVGGCRRVATEAKEPAEAHEH